MPAGAKPAQLSRSQIRLSSSTPLPQLPSIYERSESVTSQSSPSTAFLPAFCHLDRQPHSSRPTTERSERSLPCSTMELLPKIQEFFSPTPTVARKELQGQPDEGRARWPSGTPLLSG